VKQNQFLAGVIEAIASTNKLSSSSGNSIKIGSTSYTSRQFTKYFIENIDIIAKSYGRAEFYAKVEETMKSNSCKEEAVIDRMGDAVYSTILSGLRKQSKDKTAGDISLASKGYSYTNKIPVLDRKSESTLLFDSVNNCIDYQSSYDTWVKFRSHQSKDIKEIMSMAVTVAEIEYDPYDPMKVALREVNGQDEVLTINAHVIPKWRETEIENPVLPPMFEKFLAHLFCQNKDSIEYSLNWLHYMLVDRNHTMMLLHGGRGVGKGTFHAIVRRLVGSENFVLMPSGFFDSRFNEELRFKRVVCFDDFSIKREYMSEWKQLPEPYMSIEGKGTKVTTYPNHASFLITNNIEDEVALLGDERKFSVPKVEETVKVDDALGREEFDNFIRDVKDDDSVIGNIGWWLIKNGASDRFDNVHPFLSDTFYEIVEKALTNWQRGIINEIERCESDAINLAHIEDITKGTGRTKIEKFLAVHKDRDGDLFGILKQIKGGDRVIVPTDKYMPKDLVIVESSSNTDINLAEMEF
tara:strand:- start:759 stop:2327 length:1569 start_codon:yes stop_codon:yes gene_type:complete